MKLARRPARRTSATSVTTAADFVFHWSMAGIVGAPSAPGITRTREPAPIPRTGERRLSSVDVDLDPPQPEPVAQALVEVLAEPEQRPDPWWQAGLDEALSQ